MFLVCFEKLIRDWQKKLNLDKFFRPKLRKTGKHKREEQRKAIWEAEEAALSCHLKIDGDGYKGLPLY